MKITYEWRSPVYSNFDANKVGSELQRIEKKHGGVRPDAVIEVARKKGSPLHKMFEWDDSVAAHKYRQSQASAIIRNCRAVVVGPSGPQQIRGFVLVPGEEKTGYVTASTIVEEDRVQRLMEAAIKGLESWMNRYEEFQDQLPGVFFPVKSVVADYYKKQRDS